MKWGGWGGGLDKCCIVYFNAQLWTSGGYLFQQEFFTSPEHFQNQLEGQLKEMEAIVEHLLSFGKEDASLLGHTLLQLKNTCHVTSSRVGGPVM